MNRFKLSPIFATLGMDPSFGAKRHKPSSQNTEIKLARQLEQTQRELSKIEKTFLTGPPRNWEGLTGLQIYRKLRRFYSHSEKLYKAAISNLQKILGPKHLAVAETRLKLAKVYQTLEEIVAYRQTVNVKASQTTYSLLEKEYLTALPVFKQHYGAEHYKVGLLMKELGDKYEAEGRFLQAVFEDLVKKRPNAKALRRLKIQYVKAFNHAVSLYKEVIPIFEREHADFSNDSQTAFQLGHTELNLSRALYHLDALDEAEAWIYQAQDIFSHFSQYQDYYKGSFLSLMQIYRKKGEPEKARQFEDRVFELEGKPRPNSR